jgi:hypothetical protein
VKRKVRRVNQKQKLNGNRPGGLHVNDSALTGILVQQADEGLESTALGKKTGGKTRISGQYENEEEIHTTINDVEYSRDLEPEVVMDELSHDVLPFEILEAFEQLGSLQSHDSSHSSTLFQSSDFEFACISSIPTLADHSFNADSLPVPNLSDILASITSEVRSKTTPGPEPVSLYLEPFPKNSECLPSMFAAPHPSTFQTPLQYHTLTETHQHQPVFPRSQFIDLPTYSSKFSYLHAEGTSEVAYQYERLCNIISQHIADLNPGLAGNPAGLRKAMDSYKSFAHGEIKGLGRPREGRRLLEKYKAQAV